MRLFRTLSPPQPWPGARRVRARRALILVLLGLSLAAAPVLADAPGAPPAAERATKIPTVDAIKTTLPNGLEVIFHEDRRTPIVSVNLWYHVGSKDEADGRHGFAHLFEHVMFQGSKHVPEDTFFKFLEKVGASSINGTTSTDRTNYYATVPANQLELVLWLESDRMGFLLDHAGQETFESQREVVKNERRQNYENAPYGLVRKFVREHLFPKGHPYHHLTIGEPAHLDAATIDDVRAFFRRYYVPNNATLVLAGDFDRDEALALVERYFGPIPRGEDVPKTKAQPVTLTGETRIEVEAGVELPRVSVTWPTPPYYADGDADLDVLAEVLSTGKTSRLYKRLVYDLQIAQSVTAYQASMELASTFEIVATAKPGHSAGELLKIIDEELAKIRASGPTAAEVGRAKTGIVAKRVFEMERSSARANRINDYNHYLGDPSAFQKDLARTTSASRESVARAARGWLHESDRVVTLVTPREGAPVAGRITNVRKGGER